MVVIMRRPVLMEDEGRWFFVRMFATRKEAKEWLDKQEGEYFKPSDYVTFYNE